MNTCINYGSNLKICLQYYIIDTKIIRVQSNTIYCLGMHSYVVKAQRKDTPVFQTEVAFGQTGRKMTPRRGRQRALTRCIIFYLLSWVVSI